MAGRIGGMSGYGATGSALFVPSRLGHVIHLMRQHRCQPTMIGNLFINNVLQMDTPLMLLFSLTILM